MKTLHDPWIEAAKYIQPLQLKGWVPSSIQKLKGASRRWRDILCVNRFDGAHAVCLQDIDVWDSVFEVPTEAVLAGYNFSEAVKLPAKDRLQPTAPALEANFVVPLFNRDWTMRRRVEEVGQVPTVQLPQQERRTPQGPPKEGTQEPKFPEGHQEPVVEEVPEEVDANKDVTGQPAAAAAAALALNETD